MQSSPAPKSAYYKMPSLKEAAARLESKLSKDVSTSSSPDIATLLERFEEPLRDGKPPAPASGKPPTAPDRPLAQPRHEGTGVALVPAPRPSVAPGPKTIAGIPMRGLVLAALVGAALLPTAILFLLLWQDMTASPGGEDAAPAEQASTARAPASTASAHAKQNLRALNVTLSSPGRIEAEAGEDIAFPVAIDATAALPARSIVAITALPEGASLSAGRPYGLTGWSLRPDELSGLRLRLPARSAASDMHLELVTGDGTVLAQAETRLSVAGPPAAAETTAAIENTPAGIATVDPIETAPAASPQMAQVEPAVSVAESPPPPQRNPSPAGSGSDVKVNTVKLVTIKPPRETKPHDGAYALGSPADEPQAQASEEWMMTKTAVDMHAKAEQSSETVKVAAGGTKVQVTARDKNWVQVTDPKSSATGWIYNRFLKPAEAPAE